MDKTTRFDILLTRVPGIGEDVAKDENTYRVIHIQHEPVDADGRARLGWHAFADVVLIPEPPVERRPRTRRRLRTKG